MDIPTMKTHLREHIEYPATKKQIMKACNEMMDIPEADRKWFEKTLPDKKFGSADEVMKALKMR